MKRWTFISFHCPKNQDVIEFPMPTLACVILTKSIISSSFFPRITTTFIWKMELFRWVFENSEPWHKDTDFRLLWLIREPSRARSFCTSRCIDLVAAYPGWHSPGNAPVRLIISLEIYLCESSFPQSHDMLAQHQSICGQPNVLDPVDVWNLICNIGAVFSILSMILNSIYNSLY